MRRISLNDRVEDLVDDAVVTFGISGGKDSSTMVAEVSKWLDARNHPVEDRICMHADLGLIDWSQTPEFVRMQAELAGTDLRIVRRSRGDMVERWEQRWAANVTRYENLLCTTLITPWSNAQWRFCTSELKVDPIVSRLKQLYPGRRILNLTGIRREESRGRAKAPVLKEMPKLRVKTKGTRGWQWNPILEYTFEDVQAVHREFSIPWHPAYTEYGSDRLSCSFCVLASDADHEAALTCLGNEPVYKRLAELELRSSFSFKPGKWLSELKPEILGLFAGSLIHDARRNAEIRQKVEKDLPETLRLSRGCSKSVPSKPDAEALAEARRVVNETLDLNCKYLTGQQVRDRYRELLPEGKP